MRGKYIQYTRKMPAFKLVHKPNIEALLQEIKDGNEIINNLNDKISDLETEKAIIESTKDEEIKELKKEIERLTKELNTIKSS